MVCTYVPGANIARGAQYDVEKQCKAVPGLYGSQQNRVMQGRLLQDSHPVICINPEIAPEWVSSMQHGHWHGGDVLLPHDNGTEHSSSAAGGAANDGARYRPPIQLVVSSSRLQRLGPSTPWRYSTAAASGMPHAGVAVLAGCINGGSSSVVQYPAAAGTYVLSSCQPLLSRVGYETVWAADAGTQTVPQSLQLDVIRMGEGHLLSSDHQQQDSKIMHDCGTGAVQQRQQNNSSSSTGCSGAYDARPADGITSAAAAATTTAAVVQKHCKCKQRRSSPWRVIGRHPSQLVPWQNAGPPNVVPWVPTHSASGSASAATAGAAAAAEGVCRSGSSKQKQSASQQRAVSAKYAAIGRAAARERAAECAVEAWEAAQAQAAEAIHQDPYAVQQAKPASGSGQATTSNRYLQDTKPEDFAAAYFNSSCGSQRLQTVNSRQRQQHSAAALQAKAAPTRHRHSVAAGRSEQMFMQLGAPASAGARKHGTQLISHSGVTTVVPPTPRPKGCSSAGSSRQAVHQVQAPAKHSHSSAAGSGNRQVGRTMKVPIVAGARKPPITLRELLNKQKLRGNICSRGSGNGSSSSASDAVAGGLGGVQQGGMSGSSSAAAEGVAPPNRHKLASRSHSSVISHAGGTTANTCAIQGSSTHARTTAAAAEAAAAIADVAALLHSRHKWSRTNHESGNSGFAAAGAYAQGGSKEIMEGGDPESAPAAAIAAAELSALLASTSSASLATANENASDQGGLRYQATGVDVTTAAAAATAEVAALLRKHQLASNSHSSKSSSILVGNDGSAQCESEPGSDAAAVAIAATAEVAVLGAESSGLTAGNSDIAANMYDLGDKAAIVASTAAKAATAEVAAWAADPDNNSHSTASGIGTACSVNGQSGFKGHAGANDSMAAAVAGIAALTRNNSNKSNSGSSGSGQELPAASIAADMEAFDAAQQPEGTSVTQQGAGMDSSTAAAAAAAAEVLALAEEDSGSGKTDNSGSGSRSSIQYLPATASAPEAASIKVSDASTSDCPAIEHEDGHGDLHLAVQSAEALSSAVTAAWDSIAAGSRRITRASTDAVQPPQFANSSSDGNARRAGMGQSEAAQLYAEFSCDGVVVDTAASTSNILAFLLEDLSLEEVDYSMYCNTIL